MENTKVCCFTGHRPPSLPFRFNEKDERCIRLKEKLRELIIEKIEKDKVSHFISGMALGVDIYAAEIILDLKKQYSNLILEAAIPCLNQTEKWSREQQDRYFAIHNRCDKTTVIQREYTSSCMQKRNKYMVDQADFVIAVWNGSPSGTGKTVRYALSKGKNITALNPATLDVTLYD